MKWSKKGLIYCPDGSVDWIKQFAILPTPLLINKDTLRIFVGFCDTNNIGRIGYVDVSPDNPREILNISPKPVLDIGRNGCFDDNGVVPVSISKEGNQIFLYYIGFQKGVQVPYYMFCGLAISNDNGNSFYRYSQAPILDRINDEVYARCGVNVIKDDSKYKMYYIGSYKEGWTSNKGKLKPLYVMKYTESDDGKNWHNPSIQCLEYANRDEHGFGRPYVWKADGVYKMYYSIRTYSKGYYIGYAESNDGISWIRKDNEVGITHSEKGWDDTNLSYPYLYRYNNNVYMFYNGNGCGKTGFGYAELVEE